MQASSIIHHYSILLFTTTKFNDLALSLLLNNNQQHLNKSENEKPQAVLIFASFIVWGFIQLNQNEATSAFDFHCGH